MDDCADGHLFLDPCGALDGSRHWSLSPQPRMSRGHGVTTPFTVSLLENVGVRTAEMWCLRRSLETVLLIFK